MKKLNLKMLAVIFTAFVMAFSACDKDEEAIEEPPTPPTMTSITIDGENTEFSATVEFNEGVYKNNNSSGNLDETSFTVSLSGGVAGMDSYTVNHTAGNNTAEINIILTDYSDGSEELTVQPASATSIYNSSGTAMEDAQSQKITLSGTTFETINISDDGNGTGTITWTRNNTYVLHGFVFVNDGDVLTIEAGTVIKGKPGQGENASALIVARGGKIMAEGTADMPIIFTAESDNLNNNLAITDRGLWGGLIILGSAKLNSTPGESQIEGIPTNEERGRYGGNDNSNNSGVLKYVSIRHGGTDIGEGNEINGLTLGAVGTGSVIEYIEVIANKDDGVEFFGGQPQLKNILVAYVGDDCFDYDEGFSGKGQFWCAVQDANEGDRLGEHDGGTDPETGTPYAIPTIYNATYIGRGDGAGKRVITFRDNAGGNYLNSIFTNQDKGIDIENLDDDQDSYKQFTDGNLTLENNVFWAVSDGTAEGLFKVSGSGANPADSLLAVEAFAAYFTTAGNTVSDPGISIENPVPGNPVTDNLAPYDDVWFEEVTYKGAFDSDNWAAGWTRYFSEK